TPIGLKISGAFAGVRLVDFRPGRLVYLSEMKPRSEDYTPFFDVVWKIRNNQNFDGGAIRVGGKSYERGLCIHSRTLLSYRLAGEFRQFQAVMGIDELVGQKGHVRVTIKADARVLFEGDVSGGADPLPLDYDVAGVRDLEILVDFGEDLDIADHLALADARLIK
ncbi:MAG TPA: NPCBM/NEW2 domain-containing protein, partial [Planctomycetaceae bacterium]|nr:NPCBM/NEW2 domain-containing protein [Planctomycetaceae bacterium]